MRAVNALVALVPRNHSFSEGLLRLVEGLVAAVLESRAHAQFPVVTVQHRSPGKGQEPGAMSRKTSRGRGSRGVGQGRGRGRGHGNFCRSAHKRPHPADITEGEEEEGDEEGEEEEVRGTVHLQKHARPSDPSALSDERGTPKHEAEHDDEELPEYEGYTPGVCWDVEGGQVVHQGQLQSLTLHHGIPVFMSLSLSQHQRKLCWDAMGRGGVTRKATDVHGLR